MTFDKNSTLNSTSNMRQSW